TTGGSAMSAGHPMTDEIAASPKSVTLCLVWCQKQSFEAQQGGGLRWAIFRDPSASLVTPSLNHQPVDKHRRRISEMVEQGRHRCAQLGLFYSARGEYQITH